MNNYLHIPQILHPISFKSHPIYFSSGLLFSNFLSNLLSSCFFIHAPSPPPNPPPPLHSTQIPDLALAHKELTYIEYRAVSGVCRTIDPPPPLPLASVSSPRTKGGVLYTRRAVRGWGSIFRKTPHVGLASYSIIPLRFSLSTVESLAAQD
jgi:hypothetical protein